MYIKQILSLTEQTLQDEKYEMFKGHYYICNVVKCLYREGTITQKEKQRTLNFLRQHRPSESKYVKFYNNEHYKKQQENNESWWLMYWDDDKKMKEVIQQKKEFLNHLINRL